MKGSRLAREVGYNLVVGCCKGTLVGARFASLPADVDLGFYLVAGKINVSFGTGKIFTLVCPANQGIFQLRCTNV